MAIMNDLCRAAVRLYPGDFRREFGAEIIAAFEDHYCELQSRGIGRGRMVWAQLRDVLNLSGTAVAMQLENRSRIENVREAGKAREEGDGKGMENIQVNKVFFAWQAEAEARWLEAMSKEGWDFVDYWPSWYEFRHLANPRPYGFVFERRFFMPWQRRTERRFLEGMESVGWQYFKYFAGWYYFRKPLAGEPGQPEGSLPGEGLLTGELVRLGGGTALPRNRQGILAGILMAVGAVVILLNLLDPPLHWYSIIVGILDFALGMAFWPHRARTQG